MRGGRFGERKESAEKKAETRAHGPLGKSRPRGRDTNAPAYTIPSNIHRLVLLVVWRAVSGEKIRSLRLACLKHIVVVDVHSGALSKGVKASCIPGSKTLAYCTGRN